MALLVVDLVAAGAAVLRAVLVAADTATGLGTELARGAQVRCLRGLLTAGSAGADLGADLRVDPPTSLGPPAIIALLLISPIVVALVAQLIGGDAAQLLILFSPGDLLEGHERRDLRDRDRQPDDRQPRHLRAGLTSARRWGLTAVAVGLTVRRYLRIAA